MLGPRWPVSPVSLLKNLKHANIVTLHDLIHTERSLTLVFEYLVSWELLPLVAGGGVVVVGERGERGCPRSCSRIRFSDVPGLGAAWSRDLSHSWASAYAEAAGGRVGAVSSRRQDRAGLSGSVFQDSDLKQYLDHCGNLMSMHNVKVSASGRDPALGPVHLGTHLFSSPAWELPHLQGPWLLRLLRAAHEDGGKGSALQRGPGTALSASAHHRHSPSAAI